MASFTKEVSVLLSLLSFRSQISCKELKEGFPAFEIFG